jgi:Xaa-Pro dipeptidase
MEIPGTPVFPPDEFAGRLARLQEELDRRGVGLFAAFAQETVFYLTGYQTYAGRTFQALLVPRRGAPTLLVRYLESYLAALYCPGTEVVTYDDHEDALERLASEVRRRAPDSTRVALEETAPAMHAANRRRLGGLLAGFEFADASGAVERLRRIKSDREVARMRQSAQWTALGIRAAIDACRVGATENDVAAAAMAAMVKAGSEYFPIDPIVTSGFRAGVPHTTFERRRLEPGDTVLLEMTASCGRYIAPLMRSVSLGDPSPHAHRAFALCRTGLEHAMARMRPGATAEQIDDACQRVMVDAGVYESFRKRTGYSAGFAFPPGWNEGHIISLRQGDPTPLEPGMVFHMPPALRDYGVGCVGVSETVLVTPTGCEPLTRFPRELFIV